MPVARIYASLVEEAEPICADLLARGYNVEIVFPDAVLPNPPDLELRVERCSAEQAIARVEAGGSPSRCVFVTPAKGPRRELLLVEMTVLGTGTLGRHPLTIPLTGPMTVPASVATLAPITTLGSIPEVALVPFANAGPVHEIAKAPEGFATLASVLPFPVAAEVIANGLPPNGLPTKGELVVKSPPVYSLPSQPLPAEDLGRNIIAELNSFLAHAPVVERPEALPVRIFQTVRASRGVERARKNWEGWALAGVAATLVLLVALGWFAAPTTPHRNVAIAEPPYQHRSSVITTATGNPAQSSGPLFPLAQVSVESSVLTQHAPLRTQLPTQVRRRGRNSSEGNAIAVDQIRNVSSIRTVPNSSEVAQSAAIRAAQNVAPVIAATREHVALKAVPSKPVPIKRITDLK